MGPSAASNGLGSWKDLIWENSSTGKGVRAGGTSFPEVLIQEPRSGLQDPHVRNRSLLSWDLFVDEMNSYKSLPGMFWAERFSLWSTFLVFGANKFFPFLATRLCY